MMIRLLAAISLALSLLFGGDTVAAEPLEVGVGVAEITPPIGYPMSGYYHFRGATGTLDPLLAKAIVFKQGETKAALVVGDLIGIYRVLGDAVRKQVAAKTGIPFENIVVAATHSHTGPSYLEDAGKYVSLKGALIPERDRMAYIPALIDGLSNAVIAAAKDAKPVSVKVGSGSEDQVSFNRRFLLKDGTARTWARLGDPDVVKAAGPIDPEIGLVTFVPEGSDAPAAAFINFALHCDTVGGTQYSGDYPAHVERVLRKELGPQFVSVFANGTCGDINHADPTGKARRSAAEIGERIANSAAKALPALEPVKPSLGVRHAAIEIPLQSYTAEELKQAEETIAAHRRGETPPMMSLVKAFKVRLLKYRREGIAELGIETDEMLPSDIKASDKEQSEVTAIRLSDDTALVALPGEVFVELGLAIKEASPFKNTFVIELANDCEWYVPTKKAYQEGSYEVINSIYAPGGGEMLVETAVALLKDLKSR